MRKLFLGTALGLIASFAAADDVALIIGTDRYAELGRVVHGDRAPGLHREMRDAGYTVHRTAAANMGRVDRALGGFIRDVPGADRIVVVLTGRFVTDGDRTWFLTAQSDTPEYLGFADTAVSVDSLMQVMARSAGRAVLMLGYHEEHNRVFDAWLTEGVGELDIPQGVTVLTGEPRAVADFMADELIEEGGDLVRLVAANRQISAQGYVPRRMFFAAEPVVEITRVDPDGQQSVTPRPNTAAERALWSGALALDTVDAYRNYLDRYPRGIFASEAQDRIEGILTEPHRQARLTEEALQLTRDQRRGIQRNLNTLNYNTRGVDGIFGPGTRNAVTNWQQQNGYAQTGYLNGEQISRLLGQARRREQEIAEEQARADREARQAENAYWEATGGTGTVAGLRAYLDRYPDGRYAQLARQRIAAAEDARAEQARAEEQAVWDNMRAVGDIAAFENYLRLYPNGEFERQARDRLAELRAARDRDTGGVTGIEGRYEQAERSLGLNNLTRRLVETHLQALGMNPGAADGEFDEQARMAIRRYQNERGLQVTGYLDARTAAMMLSEAQ